MKKTTIFIIIFIFINIFVNEAHSLGKNNNKKFNINSEKRIFVKSTIIKVITPNSQKTYSVNSENNSLESLKIEWIYGIGNLLNFNLYSKINQKIQLRIFDLSGKVNEQRYIEINKGMNLYSLNIDNLNIGIFIASFIIDNNKKDFKFLKFE
ncbi:MAG: hypothetical protein HW421_30 [Ignavibacteria bacterium]|nr:hypothetical protein [Ignavibacteria bacterium]